MAARTTASKKLSPFNRLTPTSPGAVHWTEGFWGERFRQCRETILPSMYEALNHPENSAQFSNFYVAAGLREGAHAGTYWSDGDCYKWMEAAAHVIGVTGDKALDQTLDELINVIGQAQDPDGYISTQIQLTEKERWEHPRYHELYNMGHLLTAACVHHNTTGKDNFLNIAIKVANYLYTVFAPRPDHLAHFGFNPSNIMGCVDLYRATGEPKFLELAQIFVDMRGSAPGGTDQNQDRVPLREETEAVGHAVTATYLYCGATDIVAETGEEALHAALSRIWEDMVNRKMYITGGVGPLHHGESKRRDAVHEAFDREYHLHNATAYNETCANIGNAMWNWRLLQLTGDAKYGDLMELVVYNAGLSGIGLDGRHFCYTNPLRWYGDNHVLLSNDTPERWFLHTCYCCPPQVARTLARMQDWAYSLEDDAVWVHLYGSNRLHTRLPAGDEIALEQHTDYPWEGQVRLCILAAPAGPVSLKLRIPAWATNARLLVNGSPTGTAQPGAYAEVRRQWAVGDQVELELPLRVRALKADPRVEECRNHLAFMRGPLVYCLEGVDLDADVSLAEIHLSRNPNLTPEPGHGQLTGITILAGEGWRLVDTHRADGLYWEAAGELAVQIPVRLIPYFAWHNRGQTEMSVWLPIHG